MKISHARDVWSSECNALWQQKQTLLQKLKQAEKDGIDQGRYDRVELTRQLAETDAEYAHAQKVLGALTAKEDLTEQMQAAKENGEAMAESMSEMLKCLETARRIAEGAKVPPKDEKKLMEYSHELYMAAKNMAFLRARNKQRKEYDSLWKDEQEQTIEETQSTGELEVDPPMPEGGQADSSSGGESAADTQSPAQ